MGSWTRLFCLAAAAWSCAAAPWGRTSSAQLCEVEWRLSHDHLSSKGLNSCDSIFTVTVCEGDSQSLSLPLSNVNQMFVKKCDLKTKKWEEVLLNGLGNDHYLTEKTCSISLAGGNFTVWNAGKTEEGLYKIERHVDDSCLAIVNVTVLDPPLPVVPSFDVSSTVTSNITETPEASPPGTNCTVTVLIAVGFGVGVVLLVGAGVGLKKWINSNRRPNEATSEVDPRQLMNGSLPHEQQEITSV